MPLTVLATRETLYLLKEDHQWTKSSNSLTGNENKEPCSGNVAVLETLPISCVSSLQLWPSDQCRIDIKLYDEVSPVSSQILPRRVKYHDVNTLAFAFSTVEKSIYVQLPLILRLIPDRALFIAYNPLASDSLSANKNTVE